MFNWGLKQDTKAINAIILGEGNDKGRPFKSRFLQAGLVKYDFGVCLLKKETIDRFIDTFKGCPVVINHKDNITESDKVGEVHNIWFSDKDGWYWCDGVLTDDKAVELVENGYNVSCQYAITDYSINDTGKLHNGNPYDKEILNGLFEHLAIVDNPRYEGAYIAVNAYVAQNAICRNEFKESEHPHDDEGKFTENNDSTSYFANWDNAPEVELKTNELSSITDIKQLRKAAQDYYKNNLQGQTINKEGLGSIRFSGKGWKEFVHTSADGDKLRAIPQLPEIIKNGKLGDFQKDNKGRTDNIKGFYPIYCNLKTSSGIKKAEALIAQDTEGNLFYTMFLDYDRPIAKNKRDITSNQDRLPLNFIIASNSTDFKTSKYQPVFDWIRNFKGGIMDKETKGLFESLIDALRARNEAEDEKEKDDEKKAENKKAKNEDVDKRDIIRQIMAIAGKHEDNEDVRTIAKLAEKLAYDKSEAGTADNKAKNEDDEEEKKEDEEAKNKCKNKAKNEDEESKEKYEDLKEEVKKEAENKKAKNSMDALKRVFFEGEAPRGKIYMSQKEGIELGKKLY